MAVSTIRIPFQEDFLQQIDVVVMRESRSRDVMKEIKNN